MAFVHGKSTVVKLNGVDLSTFTSTSEVTKAADEHDVTGYGASGHAVQGGLENDKVTMGGTYANGATGPRGVIMPLISQNVPFIRQTEGAGSGKPQDAATVHVKSYVESNPVADMIKWTCELTVSGVITSTTQP